MKGITPSLIAALALWFAAEQAVAGLSAAEKLDLQNSAAGVINDAAALKAKIDALVPDVPPVVPWPRTKPSMLDIDLVNVDSLLKAKWQDGTLGYDGQGGAIHYGDMAGAVDSWQPFVIDSKLSNPSCPPKWGTDLNGLHYLETCTDGFKEPLPQYGCYTCRLTNWGFGRFAVKELYWRGLEYVYPETLTNSTDLGIKGTGVGGTLTSGGSFAEIFEYGDVTKDAIRTSFPAQAYRYDAEATQGVTVFPGFRYLPGRWYHNEGHVKVPSCATCADGVIEFKVDGTVVYSRTNVKMGAMFITSFNPQLYHGGQKAPAGLLRFKVARLALSTTGWIGPAPEFN